MCAPIKVTQDSLPSVVIILGLGFVGDRLLQSLQQQPIAGLQMVFGSYRRQVPPSVNFSETFFYDSLKCNLTKTVLQLLESHVDFDGLLQTGNSAIGEKSVASKVTRVKLVVTLPLQEHVCNQILELSQIFHECEILLYSSAGGYVGFRPGACVSEDSLLETCDKQNKLSRYYFEECLRESANASVFAISGIFGLQRSPVSWLEQGRITNADALVNLVHVSDIVAVTRLWLENSAVLKGQRVNVSSGTYLWRDLLELYKLRGLVSRNISLQNLGITQNCKRVSFQKLLTCYPCLKSYPWRLATDEAYLREVERALK